MGSANGNNGLLHIASYQQCTEAYAYTNYQTMLAQFQKGKFLAAYLLAVSTVVQNCPSSVLAGPARHTKRLVEEIKGKFGQHSTEIQILAFSPECKQLTDVNKRCPLYLNRIHKANERFSVTLSRSVMSTNFQISIDSFSLQGFH